LQGLVFIVFVMGAARWGRGSQAAVVGGLCVFQCLADVAEIQAGEPQLAARSPTFRCM
jgi:hypothetical protein